MLDSPTNTKVQMVPDRRAIYLTGHFDQEMAAQFLPFLHYLDATGPVKIEEGENAGSVSQEPIVIFLQSEGGDLYSGLTMFDAISACRSHVIMIGTGEVMSMGSILLQAADVRLLTPRTTLMVHSAQLGLSGESLHVSKQIRRIEELESEVAQIFAKRTGKSAKQMMKQISEQEWIGAKRAVDLGLADGIYDPSAKKEPVDVEFACLAVETLLHRQIDPVTVAPAPPAGEPECNQPSQDS